MSRVPIAEIRNPSFYRDQILAAGQSSVMGIIKTGRLLIEAKAALPHGEFDKMIRQELPFQKRTAQMLMAIARHPLPSNAKHVSHLPTCWSTLYELTKLPETKLAGLLESGEIRPETQRKDIQVLHREAIREHLANTAPVEDPEDCNLLEGDCWERAQEIPENSVHAIITDPPYNKASIPVFSKPPQIAMRCLRPACSTS